VARPRTPALVGARRISEVRLGHVSVAGREPDAAEHAVQSVTVVDSAFRAFVELVCRFTRPKRVGILVNALACEPDRLVRAVGDRHFRARIAAASSGRKRDGHRKNASELHTRSIDDRARR